MHDFRAWLGVWFMITSRLLACFLSHIKEKSVTERRGWGVAHGHIKAFGLFPTSKRNLYWRLVYRADMPQVYCMLGRTLCYKGAVIWHVEVVTAMVHGCLWSSYQWLCVINPLIGRAMYMYTVIVLYVFRLCQPVIFWCQCESVVLSSCLTWSTQFIFCVFSASRWDITAPFSSRLASSDNFGCHHSFSLSLSRLRSSCGNSHPCPSFLIAVWSRPSSRKQRRSFLRYLRSFPPLRLRRGLQCSADTATRVKIQELYSSRKPLERATFFLSPRPRSLV